jgi:hypothetical protein
MLSSIDAGIAISSSPQPVAYSTLVEIRLDAGNADCHMVRQLESMVTSWGLSRISPGQAVWRSNP